MTTTIKKKLHGLLLQALQTLYPQGERIPEIQVSFSNNLRHGHYASNAALMLAKTLGQAPRALAEKIVQTLSSSIRVDSIDFIEKIEIAGPGFINFFITDVAQQAIIPEIIQQGILFGRLADQQRRIHIEYVSANPTGPLHVGHGRGAAFGASLANILQACGYTVHREYYVNDQGRQMQLLALSVWLRYLGETLPVGVYQGDYVMDIAARLRAQYGDRFHAKWGAPHSADLSASTDSDAYLDECVDVAKATLGMDDFNIIFQFGLNDILNDIRDDLHEFNVDYDEWFHESVLFDKKFVEAGLALLEQHGYVFERDGAKWFRSTDFGDEKDRVLVRSNGVTTYFASDVAYHLYKYEQGYDHIIDIFGADHHGYIPRIQGFLIALGKNPEKLKTLMVQFAILYRGAEKISMSTRGGQFVTLRALRAEVGNDAARFFYVMRKPEQHLDFDLELAKSRSNDNPVYYIQYAHARMCSVWRQRNAEEPSPWSAEHGLSHLHRLTSVHERNLMGALMHYPEVIADSGRNYEPHTLAYFLSELAGFFHAYYNAEKFLVPDETLREARLCLIAAVQQVLVNGLTLLGISAPAHM